MNKNNFRVMFDQIKCKYFLERFNRNRYFEMWETLDSAGNYRSNCAYFDNVEDAEALAKKIIDREKLAIPKVIKSFNL